MKKLNTLICCVLLFAYGTFVGMTDANSSQTVKAATVSYYDPNDLPYDLRPVRTITETVHDTVYIKVPDKVTKYEYVRHKERSPKTVIKEVPVPYKDTLNIVMRFTYDSESFIIPEDTVTTDTLPNL